MVPGMGHCSGGEGPNTFDMWLRSSSGSRRGNRRSGSSPRTARTGKSIALGHCARIRRWRAIRGPENRRRRELRVPVAIDTRENCMSQPARSRAPGIALCLFVLASVPASIVHGQEQPPASTSPGRIVTDVRDVTITVSDLARSLAFYRTLGSSHRLFDTPTPGAPGRGVLDVAWRADDGTGSSGRTQDSRKRLCAAAGGVLWCRSKDRAFTHAGCGRRQIRCRGSPHRRDVCRIDEDGRGGRDAGWLSGSVSSRRRRIPSGLLPSEIRMEC